MQIGNLVWHEGHELILIMNEGEIAVGSVGTCNSSIFQGGADEHIAEARPFLGLNPAEPPILSGNSEFSWKAQITGDIR